MSDDLNPVVVEREPCHRPPAPGPPCQWWEVCKGCLGDGTRAVLDSAREVQQGNAVPYDHGLGARWSDVWVEVPR